MHRKDDRSVTPMRVLLSEASGLTARQVATRLGELGHEVEALSSERLCLARFTRHVRRVHRVPPVGDVPFAWLDAARAIAIERRAAVLFPTHEQVALLSAARSTLGVSTVVPGFASLSRLQDKIAASETLAECGLPQPRWSVLHDANADASVDEYPVFLKRPISTASSGVRKVASRSGMRTAADSLQIGSGPLLVQQAVSGPLAMVQAVADEGRLIAHHACIRVREGAGGGAAVKESTAIAGMSRHLEILVHALGWHGALSMDVVLGADGPMVIDVNPRIVEPINAFRAGVDLVGAMLELALHRHPPAQPEGREGVRSFQLLLAILGVAEGAGTRRAVMRELFRALAKHEPYEEGREELTPVRGDWLSAIPVGVAFMTAMISPRLSQRFRAGAVGAYSLTPSSWSQILTFAGAAGDGGRAPA
jgi:biotin carboxylase